MTVAFVLGGGGVRGAVEIGMIRALLERGIRPDVIAGTSIGAINDALVASEPTPAVIETLMDAWTSPEANAVYGESLFTQFTRLVKTKTHLNSPAPLRHLLERCARGGCRGRRSPRGSTRARRGSSSGSPASTSGSTSGPSRRREPGSRRNAPNA